MLIGGIVAALVVAGMVVGVAVRRRSNDDVHSVEHYHRKLHTLEEIRAHPHDVGGATPSNGNGNGHESANGSRNGDGDAHGSQTSSEDATAGHANYPASAVRMAGGSGGPGGSTVRLTDPSQAMRAVPPVPPPPLSNPSETVTFDDAGPDPIPSTFMSGNERDMEAINHRPWRLGGPLAAVAVVAVIVVVLIVTGLHSTTPVHSGRHTGTPTTAPNHSVTHAPVTHARRPAVSTTTTAPAPAVSAPTSNSSQSATYAVGSSSYALVLSATSSDCWTEATDSATGAVLYSGTLVAGQSHTVSATGPVTVVVGAPSAFAATVNGAPVTLPASYQAPLTLKFQTTQAPQPPG